MAKISLSLSAIALDGNELNSPIKMHREAEWIIKQGPTIGTYKRPTI